jgi:antitoxin PrlF
MQCSTITSKGQLTVPKSVREYLSLEPGDKIEFIIEDNGQVTLSAKNLDVDDICGIIKTKKTASIDDMNKAINQRMLKKK